MGSINSQPIDGNKIKGSSIQQNNPTGILHQLGISDTVRENFIFLNPVSRSVRGIPADCAFAYR
jgi:hypothetical protein